MRAVGLKLERTEIETVYWDIMAIADREKVVSDNDLADVVRQLRGGRGASGQTGPDHAGLQWTPAEVGLRATGINKGFC